MPDHTVRGVDRLVECAAREAGNGEPQNRRNYAVGKILRKAFDRRAGDAGFVECRRIAADDAGDAAAAAVDALLVERIRDVGDWSPAGA